MKTLHIIYLNYQKKPLLGPTKTNQFSLIYLFHTCFSVLFINPLFELFSCLNSFGRSVIF
nr:MAG TPA: hypothetical protein [Caudoviricetes sp.]